VRRTFGPSAALVQQYSYYPWNQEGGRLNTIQAGTTAIPDALLELAYAYTNDGNIETITDGHNSGQVQTFTYDALERLISARTNTLGTGQYAQETYAYDATTGNLSSKAGTIFNYLPQETDCPEKKPDGTPLAKAHAVFKAGSNNTYCYDQNGNMRRRKLGSATYTLTYDGENHMTGLSGSGKTASYGYDGDGKRIWATQNGTTTVYIGGYFE